MNLKVTSLLFIILFPFSSFSQESLLDSLNNKSYEELSINFNEKYYDKFDSIGNIYATALLIKAKEKNNIIEIANCYRYKSILSDYETSLKYCDSIIRLTENNESFDYPALGYMMKGYFLNYQGIEKEKESFDYYLKAYGYALRQKNIIHQIYILEQIGNAKVNYGNYKDGLNFYRKQQLLIKFLPEHKKHKIDIIDNNLNFSRSFLRARMYDSAYYYNQKGLLLSLQKNRIEDYHLFLSNSGAIDYFKGNYQQALDTFNKVEPFKKDDRLAVCYYYKGKIYQNTNIEKTVFYFNKIDSIYQLTKDTYVEWPDVYKTLINYHASKKDYTEQLSNIHKLIKVDSVLHSNSRYVDKEIKIQYEIPQLKQESERLKKVIRKKDQKNKLTVTLLSVLITLSIFLLLIKYFKQKKYKKRFDEFIMNQDSESHKTHEVITHKATIEKLAISKPVIQKVLINLKVFENQKDFLDNNISLANVAKDFKTNSSYLSKIVNHYKKASFSNYISELRLDHCIEKLKENKKFRNYTIEGIADEIGFNTAESFSKAFYKKTGVYPSFFIKQISKKNS
jgi:AraC-like DNA-binding protein